jgi:hypothetical protein
MAGLVLGLLFWTFLGIGPAFLTVLGIGGVPRPVTGNISSLSGATMFGALCVISCYVLPSAAAVCIRYIALLATALLYKLDSK